MARFPREYTVAFYSQAKNQIKISVEQRRHIDLEERRSPGQMSTRSCRRQERRAGGREIGGDVAPLMGERGSGSKGGAIVGVRCISPDMRFKCRNVREGREAEGLRNVERAVCESGGSERVYVGAEDRLPVFKIVRKRWFDVTRICPSNCNRDGFKRRTGGHVDVAGVKRKDGRWGLFHGSCKFFWLEPDDRGDGIEFF